MERMKGRLRLVACHELGMKLSDWAMADSRHGFLMPQILSSEQNPVFGVVDLALANLLRLLSCHDRVL